MKTWYVELQQPRYSTHYVRAESEDVAVTVAKELAGGYDPWNVVLVQEATEPSWTSDAKNLDARR